MELLHNIPKELQLILAILRDEEVQKKQVEKVDWNLFIEQTIHHRVYPNVYPKLKDLNNGIIPEVVLEKLKELYTQNTFQMLHLSGEMERLSDLFQHKNIRILFLKGPMLAPFLYGDLSLRRSRDLDVLVPLEDLQKVEQLLLSEGYEKDYPISSVLNDWKWRHRHVTYTHPTKGITVEVHWRLLTGPARELSFTELWQNRQQSQLTKKPVFMLGVEHLFFYLVLHGAQHGWSRLRWLYDIHQFSTRQLDWQYINGLMKKYGVVPVGGQGILLASSLFGSQFSHQSLFVSKKAEQLVEWTTFYLKKMINLHSDSLEEEIDRYHKRYLFNLMGKRQKVLFILSYLYPYPEDVKTLPLPEKVHFLYFILRPFLWIWRKVAVK